MRLSRSDKESEWRGFGSRLMRSRAPFLRVDRTAIHPFLEFGNHSFSPPSRPEVGVLAAQGCIATSQRSGRLTFKLKIIYWATIVNAPSRSNVLAPP
ncbi:uncharacterized protein SCHCODRAFT_01267931 [Schizophyllum commune H4-8]|uniref:uncharacterized protein n=1 Tax=Schizophyllum commune (strain H4-8 / FGSC 9210) TaxID=578458 RepID=UPI0021607657|nr:uncharacterized protein SCHCODRAFT_01267931 [Schizophyllum commune H4-8]KAI5900213.1 hypothetical protein SCHCODRAFT_01267931 [Schizophyllum commune H4-8]